MVSRYIFAFSGFLLCTSAEAVSVSRLAISDLQVGFGAQGPGAPFLQDWNSNSDIIMGEFQGTPELDANGDASRTSGILGGELLPGLTFGLYTTPDTWYGGDSPVASDVYSAPSGNLVGDELSLDLSSWTVFQADGSGGLLIINMGSYTDDVHPVPNSDASLVKTTYDPLTHSFTAEWNTAQFNFAGDRVWWHMEGIVALVPVPSALFLFGSGLCAVLGFAGRKPATSI